MTFEQCLLECARVPELLREFDRLHGTNLQLKGPPIILMVDEATGKQREDMAKFIEFVWKYVWSPLLKQA